MNAITTDNSRNASSTGTITEPFKHEGPQDISGPSSCSEQRLLRGQPGLLRGLSSQVSKSSKGGNYMSSQGNLLKCLVLLGVQIFSSHLAGTSSASIYVILPPYPSMKGLAPSPPKPPHRHWWAIRCPCNCVLLRLSKTWSIIFSFTRQINLGGPPLNSPRLINVFPELGWPKPGCSTPNIVNDC